MTTSMPADRAPAPASRPFPSVWSRAAGVVVRPRATFAALVTDPEWWTILLVSTAAAACAGALVLATPVGQQALVDQWDQAASAFGRDLSDAQYAQLEAFSQRAAWYGVASAIMTGPIAALLVSALLVLTVGRGVRPAASFRQVFSIASHAGVILALRQIVAAPIAYVRETLASATTIGTWFPTVDTSLMVGRALSLIDLFVLWWIVVLALGCSVLFRRPARPLVVSFTLLYIVVAGGLAAVIAAASDTL